MMRPGWLLLAALLLLVPGSSRGQEADRYAPLAGSFDQVRRGIEALAVSGDPRAAAVIGALAHGDLLRAADGTLYVRAGDAVTDARTGASVTLPDDAKPVRVNNAVRAAIASAIGSLELFAPDPATRARAAEAVFHSRDPAALPALDRALAAERDAGVRATMEQARAAALLASPTAAVPAQLQAIASMRARGNLDARGVLAGVAGRPPEVMAAATAAVAELDFQARLWGVAQDAFYGLSLGSVLLLAAAGLAITFGVMGVINMAHGELVMIGAYTTFVVQQALAAYAPALAGAGLVIAVPVAFVVAGGLGIAIERCLIRFLYGRPLETLLATFGLSLVLQQAVRSLFGAQNKPVSAPAWMTGGTRVGGLDFTYNRAVIVLFAILVVAGLMALLRFSSLGLRMRAVTQNRRMAALMGIRTPWTDAMTFGLGSGIAGIAGVALSQLDNVSPDLGQKYIVDSFMVVVFGGVGNLWGTVVSALSLGLLNKVLEPVAGAVLGKIVVLVLLVAFIQRKPRGLFPIKGRAVEA